MSPSRFAGDRPGFRAAPAVSESPDPDARLELLHAFRLTQDGKPLSIPMPAQRLLAFLALHDYPLHRDYVAGTLWLDSTEERASGSLRSALWRLRQPGYELVEATNHRLSLAPEIAVDVREAVTAAHRLLDPSTDVEEPELDKVLLTGDLLSGWYDDWVVIERERLRELRVHALESLCERLTARGRFGQAIEAGLAAMRGEPLRESTHRALIKLYLAEGNRADALHQYDFFRDLLHDHLGLEPSGEMKGLLGNLRS